MHYVVLYGPPASGKLTVASKVADLSGYKLVHNHLLFNVAIALYPRFSDELTAFLEELHVTLLKDAYSNSIQGIVGTMCCQDARKLSLFNRIKKEFPEMKISFSFVQIKCSHAEIKKRVLSPERSNLMKLSDPSKIDHILFQKDYSTEHEGCDTICIDTTLVEPEVSSSKIYEFIKSQKSI